MSAATMPSSICRPSPSNRRPCRYAFGRLVTLRKAAQMFKMVTTSICVAAIFAASASAAPVDWTKAGAISAVKAAPIWKGSAGVGGSYATMRATAVTTAKPYGKTRRVAGKLHAAMWDMTVTIGGHPETFCVKALGPLAGASTRFQIGGWAYTNPTGGCAHWAASGQGFFEWGGSKAVLTHP